MTSQDEIVQYFQDKAGKWRFRIRGSNGEKMVTSEAYEGGEAGARRGFEDLRQRLALYNFDQAIENNAKAWTENNLPKTTTNSPKRTKRIY